MKRIDIDIPGRRKERKHVEWDLLVSIFLYIFLGGGVFLLGIKKIRILSRKNRSHSRPVYYGTYLTLTTFLPLIVATIGCCLFECVSVHLTETITLYPIMMSFFGAVGFWYGWRRIHPNFDALKKIEGFIKKALFLMAATAVLITFSIIFSMIVESLRFFHHIPIINFLFGTDWSPHALSEAQK